MKQLLQTIIRNVKSVRGNSLAEFATTTALMATLAATAAPKLSEMSEGAKGEKSRNEIDKIIKMAGQFYQDQAEASLSGRGRFPNQSRYDVPVGGSSYTNNTALGAAHSLSGDEGRSLAHTQLGFMSENATWRNAYLSAAKELTKGMPKGYKNHRVLRDVLKGMSPILLLNSLSIRLNGPKAVTFSFIINWKTENNNDVCHSELSNCVLINRKGLIDKSDLTIHLRKDTLSKFALGELTFE